jgi:RNA polymerase sigma factor (sigma-70 family)
VSFSDTLARAQRGDGDALANLYRDHASAVFRVIRSRLRHPLRRQFDTMDLGHSVFVEVLRDLPRFEDRGEKAFHSWLAIKATSKVRMKLRKALRPHGGRREVTLTREILEWPASQEPRPLACLLRNETDGRLREALDRLDDRLRTLIHLRVEEALTYSEVAAWMDLPSAEAARKLYARALVKVRNHLKSDSSMPSTSS